MYWLPNRGDGRDRSFDYRAPTAGQNAGNYPVQGFRCSVINSRVCPEAVEAWKSVVLLLESGREEDDNGDCLVVIV